VLDKEHAHARKGIFLIDASRGFMKDGNKNRLRSQDIHKSVDTFTRQQPIERCSRMVPLAEIAANDYNLNLPRYIDSSEPEDLQDIEGHLKGGIPERDIDGRELVPGKDKKNKPVYTEAHDFVFDKKRYKADLIPPALIVARYFALEQADVDLFQAAALALEQQCEEMKEEHSGDDGLLVEAMDDGLLTTKGVKDRLKQIKCRHAFDDEREVLEA
jgi:type I restriction-modification system DNA methylase subunit